MTDTISSSSEPWPGDPLGRHRTANYLTNYLSKRYEAKKEEKGFVLAINGDWGFGKTYLLERWRDQLVTQSHPAVYFDAWQNDFTPEPLIGFISEIDTSLRPLFKNVPIATKVLNSTLSKAKQLLKPAGSVLLHAVIKHGAGMSAEKIGELIDSAVNEADEGDSGGKRKADIDALIKDLGNVFSSNLKQHSDTKRAIAAFRQSLGMLVDALEKLPDFKLPIFFFVDELDRCRPDYAIKLLEGIKHLFGVPGIYFIVATNMRQLGESTKAVYGPGFDGQRYLKRFFDLEYALPSPDNRAFARSIFANAVMPSDGYLLTGLEGQTDLPKLEQVCWIFSLYADSFSIGLRDQHQVMKVLEAACPNSAQVHIHYLFFLAMLHKKDSEIFDEMVGKGAALTSDEFKALLARAKFQSTTLSVVDQMRDSYSPGPSNKEVHLWEVAWTYFSTSWKNVTDLKEQGFNVYDFPNNLLRHVAGEVEGMYSRNTFYPSSLKGYPERIRQAGHFS